MNDDLVERLRYRALAAQPGEVISQTFAEAEVERLKAELAGHEQRNFTSLSRAAIDAARARATQAEKERDEAMEAYRVSYELGSRWRARAEAAEARSARAEGLLGEAKRILEREGQTFFICGTCGWQHDDHPETLDLYSMLMEVFDAALLSSISGEGK